MLTLPAPTHKSTPGSYNSRLPLPEDHWWRSRVQEAMAAWARERGLRLPGWRELANEVNKAVATEGMETDDTAVSRCVKGSHITWELAIPISAVLGIPPPAVISSSEAHAIALANAPVMGEIRNLIAQLRTIEEGASSHDQTPLIEPEHGFSEVRRGPDRGSAKQRR